MSTGIVKTLVRRSGDRPGRPTVLGPTLGCLLLSAAVALMAVLSETVFSASLQSATLTGMIYLVAVLGLGAFWGNSGVMSLGHVAFMALGAYTGGLLTLSVTVKASALPDLPPILRDHSVGFWLALLGVAIVVALAAVLSGCVLLRTSPAAFVIISWGVLVIVHVVLNAAVDFTRGGQALYGLSGGVGVWLATIVAVCSIVCMRVVRESPIGLQARASRENELAARANAVNVGARRWQLWIISAIPAGVSGFLMGEFLSTFSPDTFFLSVTVTIMAMVLVGGLRSVTGSLLGTALVSAVVQVLQQLESGFSIGSLHFSSLTGLSQIGLAVVILATLYLRPSGLLGDREIDEVLRDYALARKSRREQGMTPVPPFEGRRRSFLGAPIWADRSADHDAELVARNIVHNFKGVRALSDVTLQISAGEICGLIGPNGSGKTTLLNILSGTLDPTAGQVTIDGESLTGKRTDEFARAGIGRTFQEVRLFNELTVLQNLQVAAMRGSWRVGDRDAFAMTALSEFGLAGVAYRPARTLAYGIQRRLEIARAMCLRPKYLLLDEPAAGLNEAEGDELRILLERLSRTYRLGILIVDHDVNMMMRLCRRIVVLDEGHVIASGEPGTIRSNSAVIQAYLGAHGAAVAERSVSPTTERGI